MLRENYHSPNLATLQFSLSAIFKILGKFTEGIYLSMVRGFFGFLCDFRDEILSLY